MLCCFPGFHRQSNCIFWRRQQRNKKTQDVCRNLQTDAGFVYSEVFEEHSIFLQDIYTKYFANDASVLCDDIVRTHLIWLARKEARKFCQKRLGLSFEFKRLVTLNCRQKERSSVRRETERVKRPPSLPPKGFSLKVSSFLVEISTSCTM